MQAAEKGLERMMAAMDLLDKLQATGAPMALDIPASGATMLRCHER
jgi:hypothetical protein